ncbi:quaternary amine ABC transporter ATP-binding protein [Roseovarius aestuarii]|uniref:Quaternary amine transport ATP-binding protein n=1 Tax=Roseovarius aestuarii TaxID=475083 RepID=A0A1X7BP29_9RHOB|nr:glycine betaine/L-proline ABC transporter ATP-binding protein [Roseovarius aestuarii]SMC11387.1 Glycine betaine/L-proline transport ATP-binding protein ProV [Roseovarius aestuarii]
MKTQRGDHNEIKLSCRNVWKIYGAQPGQFFEGTQGHVADAGQHADTIRKADHIVANADVSFDVHVGEIFVIMGLSGSGKSTIVRCLSRLVEPTAGEVLLDGEDLLKKSNEELIDIRRHKMGMVFQSFGLMPHLNVIDNIAFPLKLQGIDEAERYAQAERVIELVGLEGRENNFPKELSGGQQQRVGIARSLAVEPDVWFLDEPFSALDPLIRKQMQDEFLRIQSKLHKSIVFITHDFQEALRIADRMAIMRDGAVVQIGRPIDLILNPADDYVREFTQDVPWERILRAEDILEDGVSQSADQGRVSEGTLVETLLPRLAGNDGGVVVEASDGTTLGVATARGLAAALAAGCATDSSVQEG